MAKTTAAVLVTACLIFEIVRFHSVNADPDPLQDFCVPETPQKIIPCNDDPNQVTADDFTSTILRQPSNTSNVLGSNVTLVDVTLFPGLNTQGLSVARLAFGPYGVNAPHVHPRASEVLYMVYGTLYVGFVTTIPDTKLFDKVLQPGDLFIFPRGLVHFQRNLGDTPALAISSLGSQRPGRTDIAPALFASTPPIMNKVLETTFQVSEIELEKLRDDVAKTLQSPAATPSLLLIASA